MGTMQHKYTREYYTGMLEDGTPAGYGAEGYGHYNDGGIRKQDLDILRRINFKGRRVLEYGFGRGESIKYVLEQCSSHYEGVDFSPVAHELAQDLLKKYSLSVPNLHQDDALIFTKNLVSKASIDGQKFDIVLMLDFVEHVQRQELKTIMNLLHKILHKSSVIVINTPAFLFDNDVFSGEINLNNEDPADVFEETSGMHCNKYSIASLHTFMIGCDFVPISEAHYFAVSDNSSYLFLRSYYDSWNIAQKSGLPLLDYEDDCVEVLPARSYIDPPIHIFSSGSLVGLGLYIADDYLKFFVNGSYDEEIIEYCESLKGRPKVIFDLGGFMGVSSLLFSRMLSQDGTVYCFEPNPHNINRIRKNLSLNIHESSQISILPYAVGNEDEETTMLMTNDVDSGRSSTSQLVSAHCTLSQNYLKGLNFYEQKIKVVRLDTFVSETGIIPDIIKVDIEGAEHFFLEGGVETLSMYKPLIFIELHSSFCALKCAQILDNIGYTPYVLTEEEDKRIMVVCCPPNHIQVPGSSCEALLERSKYEEQLVRLSRYQRANQSLNNKIQIQDSMLVEMAKSKEVILAEFTKLQREMEEKQRKLDQIQAELSQARRVLDHPVVRLQRKAWQALKFWK